MNMNMSMITFASCAKKDLSLVRLSLSNPGAICTQTCVYVCVCVHVHVVSAHMFMDVHLSKMCVHKADGSTTDLLNDPAAQPLNIGHHQIIVKPAGEEPPCQGPDAGQALVQEATHVALVLQLVHQVGTLGAEVDQLGRGGRPAAHARSSCDGCACHVHDM